MYLFGNFVFKFCQLHFEAFEAIGWATELHSVRRRRSHARSKDLQEMVEVGESNTESVSYQRLSQCKHPPKSRSRHEGQEGESALRATEKNEWIQFDISADTILENTLAGGKDQKMENGMQKIWNAEQEGRLYWN